MIKAVFFDFYNTLACYAPSAEELQVQACRELGRDVPLQTMRVAVALADHVFYEENRRYSVAMRPLDEQMDVFHHYERQILENAGVPSDRETVERMWRRVDALATNRGFALFEDVLPALQSVKQSGLIVGIITNITHDKLEALHTLGASPYIDFAVTPQDAGADKPDPAIFRTALAMAGVAPHQAVHIGDQYYIDVTGALAAGLNALLLDRLGMLSHLACPRITTLAGVAQYLQGSWGKPTSRASQP